MNEQSGYERPVNGRYWRYLYDASLLAFVIGLAFYAGRLTQRIDNMTSRGGVPISMEADMRLTIMEQEHKNFERRLEAIETDRK